MMLDNDNDSEPCQNSTPANDTSCERVVETSNQSPIKETTHPIINVTSSNSSHNRSEKTTTTEKIHHSLPPSTSTQQPSSNNSSWRKTAADLELHNSNQSYHSSIPTHSFCSRSNKRVTDDPLDERFLGFVGNSRGRVEQIPSIPYLNHREIKLLRNSFEAKYPLFLDIFKRSKTFDQFKRQIFLEADKVNQDSSYSRETKIGCIKVYLIR